MVEKSLYVYLENVLEISSVLKNSSDPLEAIEFAKRFAPEISKCIKSLGRVIFSEDPSVPRTIYIQYMLLGLSNGKLYAETSKGKIIVRNVNGEFKISIESSDSRAQSVYRRIASESAEAYS